MVGERVWYCRAPRSTAGRLRPGERSETRKHCANRVCERDGGVLSRITRAGARLNFTPLSFITIMRDGRKTYEVLGALFATQLYKVGTEERT
jgi:hypothetical protein